MHGSVTFLFEALLDMQLSLADKKGIKMLFGWAFSDSSMCFRRRKVFQTCSWVCCRFLVFAEDPPHSVNSCCDMWLKQIWPTLEMSGLGTGQAVGEAGEGSLSFPTQTLARRRQKTGNTCPREKPLQRQTPKCNSFNKCSCPNAHRT